MNRSVTHGVDLALLAGCQLRCRGESVHLPWGAQRLLSYLALHEGGASRAVVAEPSGRTAGAGVPSPQMDQLLHALAPG